MAESVIGIPKVEEIETGGGSSGPVSVKTKMTITPATSVTLPSRNQGESYDNTIYIGSYPSESKFLLVLISGKEMYCGSSINIPVITQNGGQSHYGFGATCYITGGSIRIKAYVAGVDSWGFNGINGSLGSMHILSFL